MPSNSQSQQARRLVCMMKEFLTGRKYTTKELRQIIFEKLGTDIDIRSIQRDLKVLQDELPVLESDRIGKEIIWRIPRNLMTSGNVIRLDSNELLSFHVLKAHLKTFSGTVIEEEVKELARKLETIAPEDIFSEESLYWDQNIGQFDYTQYDPIIRRIIKYIASKRWVEIKYNASGKGEFRSHTVLFRSMFSYSGTLYVVAFIPKYKDHIAFAVQYIETIKPAGEDFPKPPEFDFRKWTKNRFGVFWGSPRKVVLKVKKHMSHYFTNRIWHQSQKLTYDDNGDLLIQLRVPTGPDILSWILSWSGAMTVIKPKDLKYEVFFRLKSTIKDYQD